MSAHLRLQVSIFYGEVIPMRQRILIPFVLLICGLATAAAAAGPSPEVLAHIEGLRAEIAEKGYTYTVGYNPAMEYPLEVLCGYIPPPDEFVASAPHDYSLGALGQPSLPSRWDWRDVDGVTPIRNQGGCGSCWAFGTVAALECNIKIADGITADLSEQYLVSCAEAYHGCNGGWEAHQYFHDTPAGDGGTGAVLEADFPYAAADLPCGGPYQHHYFLDGWSYVGAGRDEIPSVESIKQAIKNYGPIFIAVHVGPSFGAYTGGIFNNDEDGYVNHAVALVGWDDNGGEGYWILRNSWGEGWGESGYMRIRYGCSQVGYGASYVVYAGGAISSDGVIELDRGAYSCHTNAHNVVHVTVMDADLSGTGSATVILESYADPGSNQLWDVEELVLPETDAGNGVFTNSIMVTCGPVSHFDLYLQATNGGIIVATYTDADDGAGGSNIAKTAWAVVDCVPPVLSSPEVVGVWDDGASLSWVTDESSDSFAVAVSNIPPTGVEGLPRTGSSDLVTQTNAAGQYLHSLAITGLVHGTIYYVGLVSADLAGNEGSLPVGLTSADEDDYLELVTRWLITVYERDFEDGPNDWTHGGLDDVWEFGSPSFGPSAAYSGTNCWGTDLDGYYENIMNAWLASEPVSVGGYPKVSFVTWYDIESGWDKGWVEVSNGNGWFNVTPRGFGGAAFASGVSGGWVPVSINLRDGVTATNGSGLVFTNEFAYKTLQIRFRLQTDSSVTRPGWFIDDVAFSYVPEPGIIVDGLVHPVDDGPAHSSHNDGDGYPEIGETFYLGFRIYNSDYVDHSNLTAVVDCPSDGVTVPEDYSTVGYPYVEAGRDVASSGGIKIIVTNDESVLAEKIPLFHSATDGSSNVWEDIVYLELGRRESVSGVVTNFAGIPIEGATVTGRASGMPELTATSLPSGQYTLHGFVPGYTYSVSAVKPGVYSPSAERQVVGPASGVNFALGKAVADLDPPSITVSMHQGATTNIPLEVANTDAAADLPLVFHMASGLNVWGLAVDFSTSSNDVTVAVGSDTSITVSMTAASAAVGSYSGALQVVGNDFRTSLLEIPVALTITPGAILFYDRVDTTDTDGDGYCEPGETVGATPWLRNFGQMAANGVTGMVTFTGTAGAAVTVRDLDYGTIASDGADWSSLSPASIQIDPGVAVGTELPFGLDVWDDQQCHWTFNFTLTVEGRGTVMGHVTEAAPGSGPIPDVQVIAWGSDGSFHSATTDGSGAYRIDGLAPGTYTVSPEEIEGYGAAPSLVCVLTTGICTADFALPRLNISFSPSSFTIALPEGRETNDVLSISNDGAADIEIRLRGSMVEGELSASPGTVPAGTAVNWAGLEPGTVSSDMLVVRFAEGTGARQMSTACAALGGTVLSSMKTLPICLVKLPPSTALASAAAAYASLANVVYVEPDYLYELDEVLDEPRYEPDDTKFKSDNMWGLDNNGTFISAPSTAGADIDAPEAWYLCRGDSNVIVAVIDSGIKYDHEDLATNMWRNPGEDWNPDGTPGGNGADDDGNGYIDDYHGADFTMPTNMPGNGDPFDNYGHGTHVAGTIGAVGNNAMGVVGVCWNVRLMALKIGNRSVSSYAASLALEYAVAAGASVANNSWGGLQFSHAFHDAVQLAKSSNVVVVCAAGNDGTDNNAVPHYPASDPSENIVSVAATDADDMLAFFSCYGADSVDIAAPGEYIYSTVIWTNKYDLGSGTSMASPHVAGVAALVKAFAPAATWDMVKAAILEGAVPDPRLAGKMVTGGHLSAYRALHKVGAYWLGFDPQTVVIPASDSRNVTVTFNKGGGLQAGVYKADIILESGVTRTNKVPVTLSVSYAPVPRFSSARVHDPAPGGDGDGFAEPGETVAVHVSLYNSGSLSMLPSSGVLGTTNAGVTFGAGGLTWAGFTSDEILKSATPEAVTFSSTPPSNVLFNLTVSDGVNAPWTDLAFSLDVVTRHSITGRVTDSVTGVGIEGATVEYYGSGAGSTVSDSDGFYRADGLADGSFTLRARRAGYGRHPWTNAVIAGSDAAVGMVLGAPNGQVIPTNILMRVLADEVSTTNLIAINSGDAAWHSRAYEITGARIALISDGTQLSGLAPLIEAFGVECDIYEDNYLSLYTAWEGILSAYDVVIADLSGPDSNGRRIEYWELFPMQDYVYAGGRLILTGRKLLGEPDNGGLADLVGSAEVGLQRVMSDVGVMVASAGEPFFDGPFCQMAPGDKVAVAVQMYDNAIGDTNLSATAMLRVGGADKIIHRRLGGGEVVYWSGNVDGAEWVNPGPLQDIFKNALFSLISADIAWLDVAVPTPLSVAPGTVDSSLFLQADAAAAPGIGTNTAAVLFAGNLPGIPDVSVRLTLSVEHTAIVASSAAGVRRWDDTLLQGDGSSTSCIFQVVYAGPDGTNDLPNSNGSATGDDALLLTLYGGDPFGRFGDGYEQEPDFGRFQKPFSHDLLSGWRVYVRAWDADTFEGAVAYGDSAAHNMARVAGETKDFGTWTVASVLGYPGDSSLGMGDHDGDSVPDGWCVKFGADPRNRIAPLPDTIIPVISNAVAGTYGTGAANFKYPGRVAVDSNFVYVADSWNHRIQVWNRSLTAFVSTFGSTLGSGTDQFNKPQGLARDPTGNRLVVADTGNYRVMVLNVNPATGALSYSHQFGNRGDGNEEFDAPYDVAVGSAGKIYVADSFDLGSTCNHRIQVFSGAGVWLKTFGSYGTSAGSFKRPLGICVDGYGLIYVADCDNHRVQCFNGAGSFLWRTGTDGTGDGQFNRPRDVRIGVGGRLYVADTSNHRIQIFDISGAPFNIVHLGSYGQYGTTSPGEFNNPQGVCPALDEDVVYVADTWNHRVQRLRLIIDADGDGMDDIWEDLNGLNSDDPTDADGDDDRDGLTNIGEFRLRTNPQVRDSNNNGAGDGWDVVHGLHPLGSGGAPVDPPGVVISSDAGNSVKHAGCTVRIYAEFDESMTNDPPPQVILAGGAVLTPTAMVRSNATLYYYDYVVQEEDTGPVAAQVTGAKDLQGYSLDPDPAGQSPLFNTKYLELTDISDDPLVLSWESVSGGVYQIQYTYDLTDTNWLDDGVVTSALDGVWVWTNGIPGTAVHCRVKWLGP